MTSIIINNPRGVGKTEFARLIREALTTPDTNLSVTINDSDRVAELEEIVTALRELAVAQQRLHDQQRDQYLAEIQRLEYEADEAYAHGVNDERARHTGTPDEQIYALAAFLLRLHYPHGVGIEALALTDASRNNRLCRSESLFTPGRIYWTANPKADA